MQLAAGLNEPQGVLETIAEALSSGAQLVVVPELAIPGYVLDAETLAASAESIDGPTVRGWIRCLAGTDRIIVGGFCERADGHLYNSVAVVSGSGLLGHYRKLHLFGQERLIFAPGDLGLPVIETPLGRIGVCVCYDLRFVEVVRILALRGAQIVTVPTAWVPGFDEEGCDVNGWAPQARSARVLANLNQVEIACASVGGSFNGQTFLGSSVLLGPRGEPHAGPLPSDDRGVAIATIDLYDIDRASTRGPYADPRVDRRTDVYRIDTGGELL